MKVIFASLSAALLGSIPGVLSVEPNLRGATLVTDFEDYVADEDISFKKIRRYDVPKKVKKELKNIEKNSDLDKKEIKSEQKKIIKKWEKKTKKYCAEHRSAKACDVKKCVWMSDTCVATKSLYEDFLFDSSEDNVADEDISFKKIRRYDVPKKVKKELKGIGKNSDLDKKEIKSEQKKIIKKWEKKTKKYCAEHRSAKACDVKKCVWMSDTCVATKSLYEDFLFDSSEDNVADEDISFKKIRRYEVPKKVKKELKNIGKNSDLDKKEIKSEQEKIIKKWEKRTKKYCAEHRSAKACDVKKCVWMSDTCVATKTFDSEDYDFVEDSEKYVTDEVYDFYEDPEDYDSEDYDWEM